MLHTLMINPQLTIIIIFGITGIVAVAWPTGYIIGRRSSQLSELTRARARIHALESDLRDARSRIKTGQALTKASAVKLDVLVEQACAALSVMRAAEYAVAAEYDTGNDDTLLDIPIMGYCNCKTKEAI